MKKTTEEIISFAIGIIMIAMTLGLILFVEITCK